MLDLDDADQSYIKDFLPEGAVPVEFIVITKFFDAEGEPKFKAWSPSDSHLDAQLGLLEMAKFKFVATSGSMEKWQDEAGGD